MYERPMPYFTIEDYYALELASDRRWEWWDGEIFCMSGGTKEHGRIIANVFGLLSQAAKRKGCIAFGEGQPIDTPTLPSYKYADVSVVCGEPQFKRVAQGIDVLTNPILLVEVTSPSSERVDTGVKFEAYQGIPSLNDYLLISSTRRSVALWSKVYKDIGLPKTWGSNPEWRLRECGETIPIDSDITLSIDEIYKGVNFDDQQTTTRTT